LRDFLKDSSRGANDSFFAPAAAKRFAGYANGGKHHLARSLLGKHAGTLYQPQLGGNVAETWLSVAEACERTGWTARNLRRAVTAEHRRADADGKGRIYPLSLLPHFAQIKHAELLARESCAITVREETALQHSQTAKESTPRRPAIVTEQKRELVARRLAAIAELLEFHKLRKRATRREFLRERGVDTFAKLAQRAADLSGAAKSGRHLQRWLRDYLEWGEPGLAGVIREDRGKSHFFENHPTAGLFIRSKFQTERLTYRLAWKALKREWKKIGEKGDPPCYDAVRRYLQASTPKEALMLAREGERALVAKGVPTIIRDRSEILANDWWILDHRVHDVFVYNQIFPDDVIERGKMYRIWLTAVYDWGSQKLVGAIWAPTPSSRTIGAALRMAIANVGLPRNLYWDNGKDFKAVGRSLRTPQIDDLLASQQIEISETTPFNARSKPIESYFTRWSKQFDVIWGRAYCGNQPKNCSEPCRGAQRLHAEWLAESRAKTIIPPDSLYLEAALQRVDEFNDEALEPLDGRTPNRVFDEQCPPDRRRHADRNVIARLFWQRDERMVNQGGCVQLNNVRYEPVDEESFVALQAAWKTYVAIARDPYDLSTAMAFDKESGELLGELRIQEAVPQSPHGNLSIDGIKAGQRRKRAVVRHAKLYLAAMEAAAAANGWKTEVEYLIERARGVRTGTDARILGAAPGAGFSAPQLPAAARPQLAPAFVSDGVADDDFGPVELEK
jgi:hypothetical protein